MATQKKITEKKGNDIVVVSETPAAQAPEDFTGIQLSDPKDKAAGVPGVLAAVSHAFHYMSPVDAVKTMFKLNQKGGFDCPGCAWPDPDDERSRLGEYCENGIKAIAE